MLCCILHGHACGEAGGQCLEAVLEPLAAAAVSRHVRITFVACSQSGVPCGLAGKTCGSAAYQEVQAFQEQSMVQLQIDLSVSACTTQTVL